MINVEELYKIINQTECEYSAEATVMSLFEKQVAQNPEQLAVTSDQGSLTYDELNRKSNALAHELIRKGISPNQIVPIWMQRSLETIVAVFATLKAGAAYLPLDMSSPSKRILNIIQNTKSSLLLTRLQEIPIENYEGSSIYVNALMDAQEDLKNPPLRCRPTDLAYVCYTSGSTGNPKGVQIEHHSLVNRLEWMQKKFPMSSEDRILHKTVFSFDVSIWEILWWAIAGASVVLLPPKKEHDPRVIAKFIREHGVTVVHFVPSVLQVFLEYLSYQEFTFKLKWVFASGESLTAKIVHEFYSIFNNQRTRLINLYGPTEAAIDVSFFECMPNIVYNFVPIGKPISNLRLYVITESNRLAEVEEPGELLIGGVGLARGYLNDPELTKAKFVHLSDISEDRVYRTGDLAKLQSDGTFAYLGRIDEQVKIRGLRIELGEIEACLNQHPEVKNSSVIVFERESSNPILTAFLTLKKEEEIENGNIFQHLSHLLPPYMIPTRLEFIKTFPLKNNGKVDKKELEKIILKNGIA